MGRHMHKCMYMCCYSFTLCRVSKHPLRVHSSSSSSSNPLFSSAIVFDADTNGDPAHSSMIIGLHDNGPPDVSPIGCSGVGGSSDMQSVSVERECVSVSSEEEGGSANCKEMKEKEGFDDNRKEQLVDEVPNQQKFPSTPSKDVHMQVSTCTVNSKYFVVSDSLAYVNIKHMKINDNMVWGCLVSLSPRPTSCSTGCIASLAHSGDAIHSVLQEAGLGDSKTRGCLSKNYFNTKLYRIIFYTRNIHDLWHVILCTLIIINT